MKNSNEKIKAAFAFNSSMPEKENVYKPVTSKTTELRNKVETITGFGASNNMISRYLFEACKKNKKDSNQMLNYYIINPDKFVDFINNDSFCSEHFKRNKRNK